MMRLQMIVLAFVWIGPAMVSAGRVMILPFEAVSSQDRQADLGQGITQAIQLEIARMPAMTFVASASPLVEHVGIEAACELAGQSSAEYVVLGSYQVSQTQIRVNGYMIRASDSQIIATLKVTDESSELFAIQDTLAEQVKRALLRVQSPKNVPSTGKSTEAYQPMVSSGPVKARIDTFTPIHWQSPQQQRLTQTANASLRRSPGYTWHYPWYGWPYYYSSYWSVWIP